MPSRRAVAIGNNSNANIDCISYTKLLLRASAHFVRESFGCEHASVGTNLPVKFYAHSLAKEQE